MRFFNILKRLNIKFILYKFHFFIIKQIDINNVFLNNKIFIFVFDLIKT